MGCFRHLGSPRDRMYGHICQASAHRGYIRRTSSDWVLDICPARGSDCNEPQTQPAWSSTCENVITGEEGHTPSEGGTVPCDGNTPIAQGRHGLIILGGNTPSREDSKRTSASRNEILTVDMKKEGVSTNPLDSRHAGEGGRYRQGAAFGALTGCNFTGTDFGHSAGDSGSLPRDQ